MCERCVNGAQAMRRVNDVGIAYATEDGVQVWTTSGLSASHSARLLRADRIAEFYVVRWDGSGWERVADDWALGLIESRLEPRDEAEYDEMLRLWYLDEARRIDPRAEAYHADDDAFPWRDERTPVTPVKAKKARPQIDAEGL